MKTYRKMNVVVTLLITTDVETDEETNNTEVTLKNVGNSVLATTVSREGATEMGKEVQNAVAGVIVKAGLQFMLNEMDGAHKDPPPAVNQPTATA